MEVDRDEASTALRSTATWCETTVDESRARKEHRYIAAAVVGVAAVVVALTLAHSVSNGSQQSQSHQGALPLNNLGDPNGVAVDSGGTVYVADVVEGLETMTQSANLGNNLARSLDHRDAVAVLRTLKDAGYRLPPIPYIHGPRSRVALARNRTKGIVACVSVLLSEGRVRR